MKNEIFIRVYLDETIWIAHCLNYDLVSTGKSRGEALKSLDVQLKCYLEFGEKYNVTQYAQFLAPREYWPSKDLIDQAPEK